MGRLAEPAQTFRLPNSEGKLQTELNQARKVDRVGHLPERRTGLGSVGRPELRMVKNVEELRPEFHVCPFGNVGLLEHREVEVVYSLLTERSIYSGFVAEGPRVDLRTCRVDTARCREARCIEPPRDAGDGTSGNVLVAS